MNCKREKKAKESQTEAIKRSKEAITERDRTVERNSAMNSEVKKRLKKVRQTSENRVEKRST